MKVKDDKFIFQGVYNLLYGTVELGMVSAEAAAVIGDTRILSADQVKVHFWKLVAEKKYYYRSLWELSLIWFPFFQAKDIVLESMSIVRMLLRTLAIRSAVSQSPKKFHVPGMDVMLGRETSCGLEEKRLNFSEGQSFQLPQNMRQAFPNEQVKETEYRVSAVYLV